MAMGSPLVLADVPNLRDSAREAAEYFAPGDVNRLSDLFLQLHADSTYRQDLARRGTIQLGDRDWLAATRAILQSLHFI
jgi:hypothetical protein